MVMADRVTIHHGDSRDVLRIIADNSIDSCVCDPPYALVSIVKRFGSANAAEVKPGSVYARASAGFMGKEWDTGETAFDPAFWAEVLRVLKPGAHLVAFGGTRSYHRLACAVEDAGFEIRDMLSWLYGSGFPKSHNQGDGWGTALKPACEPIVFARKPLSEKTVAENVRRWGVGALNIDGCRIHAEDAKGGAYTVTRLKPGATLNRTGGNWRPDGGDVFHGEMKPGRWPANVLHDGSPEVVRTFPDAPGQQRALVGGEDSGNQGYGKLGARAAFAPRSDEGSAARFFYTAKADAEDRLGTRHPTVKPVNLMRWLVRLVTPAGGVVLDPFAGSGSTGVAAIAEGMRAVLIEREAEYVADIRRRVAWTTGQGELTGQAIARRKGAAADLGPLFGGGAA